MLSLESAVGAGINVEHAFSTVNNKGYGCGSKVTHNLARLFGVMQGARSDLCSGLPLQRVEIHGPMRLLVVVEHALATSQRATSTPCLRRWPQAPACLLWLVPLRPLLASALIAVRLFL